MLASAHATSIPWGSSLGLGFLFLGICVFAGIAALSQSGERAFSGSIVYLALGVIAGIVVRTTGIGRLASPLGEHVVLERVTDGALVLDLFSTGMRIRRRPTLDGWHLTLRLLGIGMPAAVGLAALWGRALMGLGVGAAIALGAALAPTDPVLAGDLGVDPPREDEKEAAPEPEFVLTSEAGANDGLAMPFLLLGVAVAQGGSLWHWALARVVYGIPVAIAIGAGVGWSAAVVTARLRRTFLSTDYDRWVGLASAFVAYGAADAAGAYGVVAAFAGGIAFRRQELEHEYRRDVHDGADVLKQFAELAVIVVLGSMLSLNGFHRAGPWGLALAPFAILVIRPLTALVSIARTKRLTMREQLWVAWFGVKGVASLNYVAVAVAAGAFGADAPVLVWTVLTCTAASIVVHGITASPLTSVLLRRGRNLAGGDPLGGVGYRALDREWTADAAGLNGGAAPTLRRSRRSRRRAT